MNQFIDTLCKRRLCLPSNYDINLLRSGKATNYKTCDCIGTSQHISCTFDGKLSCFKTIELWDKYV